MSKRSAATTLSPAPAKRVADPTTKAGGSIEASGSAILQKNQILRGLSGAPTPPGRSTSLISTSTTLPVTTSPVTTSPVTTSPVTTSPITTSPVTTTTPNRTSAANSLSPVSASSSSSVPALTPLPISCPVTNQPPAFKPDVTVSTLQNDLRDLAKLVQMRDLILALNNHVDPTDTASLDLDDLQYQFNLIEGSYVCKNQKSLHEARDNPVFRSCCRDRAGYGSSWKQMRHRIITTETHLGYIYERLFRQEFDLNRFGQWWGTNRKAEDHKVAVFELLGFANIRTEAGYSYFVLNFTRVYDSEGPMANLSTHFQLEIAKLLQRLFCEPPGFGLDLATYLKEHVLTGPK